MKKNTITTNIDLENAMKANPSHFLGEIQKGQRVEKMGFEYQYADFMLGFFGLDELIGTWNKVFPNMKIAA